MSMTLARTFVKKTNIDADYILYEILKTLGLEEDTEAMGTSGDSTTMIVDSNRKVIGKITQKPGQMLIQKITE